MRERSDRRRIDRQLIADVAWAPAEEPPVYVCGPDGFVEAATNALVELGQEPAGIRAERFGPTG